MNLQRAGSGLEAHGGRAAGEGGQRESTAVARVGGGRTWVLVVAMAVVANGAGVLGLLRKGLCVLLWRGGAQCRREHGFSSPHLLLCHPSG